MTLRQVFCRTGSPLVRRVRTTAAALAASLTLATAAQPGSVDPTFNPGRGPLSVSAGEGSGVLIQPDGKIIVGGNFNGVGLREVPPMVRFHADGKVDDTFDASTLAFEAIALNGATEIVPFALQPDGKVLAGPGDFNNSYGPRALIRLLPSGEVDASFAPQFTSSNSTPHVFRAAVQADGRIVVSGAFEQINCINRRHLARLNPDGTVDGTFNPARSGPFQLQANGKLIVASDTLYRLQSDGSIDPSFSAQVPRDDSGYGSVGTFLVQPDGKVVYTQRLNFYGTDAVRRLNADGSNDASFKVAYAQFVFLNLIQADGRIVAGSLRFHPDGTPDETFKAAGLEFSAMAQQADGRLVAAARFSTAPFGVRRVLSDGSLDPTFQVDGEGLTAIVRKKAERAAHLPDGRIAVAGPFSHFDTAPRRGLAVLHADGTVDERFDAGELIALQPYDTGTVSALVAQADGRLLVSHSRGLVRLNADGSVDSTFNPSAPAYGVTLQPDGRILTSARGGGLVRLLSDGSHDPSFTSAVSGAEVLLLEADGRMIVRGQSRIAARLHPDGSLDDSFVGVGGSPTFDRVKAIALHPDGGYIVSRSDVVNTKGDLLFRTFDDGSRDPSFNSDVASVSHIVVGADGITVAGDISQLKGWPGGQTTAGVTRLNLDGSRDPSFAPARFDGAASVAQLLRQPDGNLMITGDFTEVNGVPRAGIARLIGNTPHLLANISTRVRVGAEQAAAIGGFIVVGDAPKKVIVRALGPSLASSGLPTSALLADPAVDLIDASGAVVARNNDWREAEAEVNATGIPPREQSESAIVATLAPGAYTAVVRDAGGGSGLALVEIYDLNPGTGSALANISTRSDVQEGENVMIGGFILRGTEASTVVARAIGPSLAGAGVVDVLADPSLTVHDESGEVVAANDDWRLSQRAELEAMQLGAAHDREAAIIATLPPGAYTTIVRGQGGDGGVGLIEIYNLGPRAGAP